MRDYACLRAKYHNCAHMRGLGLSHKCVVLSLAFKYENFSKFACSRVKFEGSINVSRAHAGVLTILASTRIFKAFVIDWINHDLLKTKELKRHNMREMNAKKMYFLL